METRSLRDCLNGEILRHAEISERMQELETLCVAGKQNFEVEVNRLRTDLAMACEEQDNAKKQRRSSYRQKDDAQTQTDKDFGQNNGHLASSEYTSSRYITLIREIKELQRFINTLVEKQANTPEIRKSTAADPVFAEKHMRAPRSAQTAPGAIEQDIYGRDPREGGDKPAGQDPGISQPADAGFSPLKTLRESPKYYSKVLQSTTASTTASTATRIVDQPQ